MKKKRSAKDTGPFPKGAAWIDQAKWGALALRLVMKSTSRSSPFLVYALLGTEAHHGQLVGNANPEGFETAMRVSSLAAQYQA